MIIGLTGFAGAGKSAVADILVSNHGFTRMRFAGPLKAMLRELGLTEEEVDGDLKEVPCALLGGKTPRHAMVTLGTEWGRTLIDWDMWTRALMLQIDKQQAKFNDWSDFGQNGANRIVVDDCRFLNEIEALRQRGAEIWRINRPGVVALTDHPSEKEWTMTGHDLWIDNHSSMDNLKYTVELAVSSFL